MNTAEIKMTYKDLLHPRLQQVLGKIANTPMNGHDGYEVNKVLSEVRKALKAGKEKSNEALKPFVKFEKGQPVEKKDAEGQFTGELDFLDGFSMEHADFEAAMDAFEKTEVILNHRPLTLHQIRDVRVSPMEIDILGALLTDRLPLPVPAEVGQAMGSVTGLRGN